jgi:hypothetical protein
MPSQNLARASDIGCLHQIAEIEAIALCRLFLAIHKKKENNAIS